MTSRYTLYPLRLCVCRSAFGKKRPLPPRLGILAFMPSEVVPDVLNGLVAAGTLALAGATVFVGRAAVRASVDGRCPRTIVTQLQVEDEPRNWPVAAKAEAGKIKPGVSWSMAQHGADRIGLTAVAQLRNERAVTALFRIEYHQDCEVGTVLCRDPTGGLAVPETGQQQDGWHVIVPGGMADISIIWWQRAFAWAQAWERGAQDPESSAPTTTVRLIVHGASGDAVDRCELAFGGYVVVRHPREDGWVIATVDRSWREIPGTTPKRVVRIGLMRRSYPGFFRRRAADPPRRHHRHASLRRRVSKQGREDLEDSRQG